MNFNDFKLLFPLYFCRILKNLRQIAKNFRFGKQLKKQFKNLLLKIPGEIVKNFHFEKLLLRRSLYLISDSQRQI
jgi:hypothetical protein